MTQIPILNICQRINSVMADVQYVQKDKQVRAGNTNYKAVTHDKVVSVARASLVKNGIMMYPNQIHGEFLIKRDVNATPHPVNMSLYTGTYEINFVNIADPNDKITVTIQAHANDNGDKAPGKALTYATKAAILKVLCLETGEDDESREGIKEENKAVEAAIYKAICDANSASIETIKQGIENNELSTAAEAWFELDNKTKQDLWKAPSKGGIFTTAERATIQTEAFRTSYYGQ